MTDRIPDLPVPVQMLQFITGYWVSKLVYVAAKLGLADHLAGGPASVDELASKAGAKPDRLLRCLRALASVGVFAQQEDGRFALTPLAETLRSDRPDSMRDFALMMCESYNWKAWDELLGGVVDDGIPFDAVYGQKSFDYLAEHPEDEEIFARSMASISGLENPAIAAAYDFKTHATVVDIGGSGGHLLAAVLEAHPGVRGVLFDQPQIVGAARGSTLLKHGDLAERITFAGGDFFSSVPAGADAYMMKYILHDWDDDQSVQILSNCREAMGEGGRVLVIDSVLDSGNAPQWGKLLDINMLVLTGGRERTQADFADLFARSGLRLQQVVPTACPLSIVVAERA